MEQRIAGPTTPPYETAFGLASGASACPDTVTTCVGYELMTSITLSGDWDPIASYGGTFDGNGNTISGLTIDASEDGQYGLFADITGTVRDVGLVDIDITVTATSTLALGNGRRGRPGGNELRDHIGKLRDRGASTSHGATSLAQATSEVWSARTRDRSPPATLPWP